MMQQAQKHELNDLAHGTTDVEPKLHWRTWAVFAGICLSGIGVNMTLTSTGFYLAYAIPSLGSPKIAVWFADGGLVLSLGIAPLLGEIIDLGNVTRKWVAVFTALMGVVGLVVAGSAKNMTVAIVGSCITGFPLAGMADYAAICADILPRRMRGRAQGYFYGSATLGSIIATTGGAMFIENNVGGAGGWRWNLYLSAFFFGLSAIVVAILYQPVTTRGHDDIPYIKRLQGIDWLGWIFWCLAVIPFLMAIIWGGNTYPWKSAAVIASFSVSGFFVIVFILHQYFVKTNGIFNHRLFDDRNFPICFFCMLVEGIIYGYCLVWLPQLISTLYTKNVLKIGTHFLVLVISSGAFALLAGWYSQTFKKVRLPLLSSNVLFVGGLIGMSQLALRSFDEPLSYLFATLLGAGFGSPFALLIATAQLAVPADLSGICTNHMINARGFGAALGIAISSAIFTNKIAVLLPQKIAEAALSAGVAASELPALIGAIAAGGSINLPGLTAQQISVSVEGALRAFAESYSYVWYSGIPFAGVAFICLCFLRPVDHLMNWLVDAPQKGVVFADVEYEDKIEKV